MKINIATGAGAAERWRKTYQCGGRWMLTAFGDTEAIYTKLCELGSNPAPDDVAAAIGNKGWSHILCDECGDYVLRAMSFGEHAETNICQTCVKIASVAISV